MTEATGSESETMTIEERCARLTTLASEVADLLKPVEGASFLKVNLYKGSVEEVSVCIAGEERLRRLGDIIAEEPFRDSDGATSQGIFISVGNVRFWGRRFLEATDPLGKLAVAMDAALKNVVDAGGGR